MTHALSRQRLHALLRSFRDLHVAVVGDFFLDSYLDCNQQLNETSLETGRTCYQVVRTRRQAGAAGTVAANLVALGAGTVSAVGFCGEDGEGWELQRDMTRLGLEQNGFFCTPDRFTPTYCKPCFVEGKGRALQVTEELERIDSRNRRPTPPSLQDRIIEALDSGVRHWDAVVVVDQVSEAGCGVITTRVRRHLRDLCRHHTEVVFVADSRERIQQFAAMPIKPNHHEAARALGLAPAHTIAAAREQARRLSGAAGRPVYLTLSERGMVICHDGETHHVPGFPVVDRPVDPVGAGDSTTAALACCLAAGAGHGEAAWLANLVGSITVQQIGTTGTATPAQVRSRWKEVSTGIPGS